MQTKLQALCDFLNAAHSVYHVQSSLQRILTDAGYTHLREAQPWELVPGGKYFLTRGGTSLIAFRVPEEAPVGFLMSASHTDRPCFKLKTNGELSGVYTRAGVERYGSQLLFTWLDRPLSVAGRVLVETPEGAETRLVDIDRDLMLIPNVAIHMNRQVNDGYKWNPTTDGIPLLGTAQARGQLLQLLETAAGGHILGHDLSLYVRQPASIWGLEENYLSAAALDDLSCVWGCLQGFLNAGPSRSIPVFCALDSEEVGSRSAQGAGSTLLEYTLLRIAGTLEVPLHPLLAQSVLISADNAHALHPNHPELSDPANAPLLGGGVVIKFNANLKYSTDGMGAALFRKVCQRAGVAVQTYCNRPDIPGGSTLGCISIGHVSVPTVDIGLPQLAMHSCYETQAVSDAMDLELAMAEFFGSTLTLDERGFRLESAATNAQ